MGGKTDFIRDSDYHARSRDPHAMLLQLIVLKTRMRVVLSTHASLIRFYSPHISAHSHVAGVSPTCLSQNVTRVHVLPPCIPLSMIDLSAISAFLARTRRRGAFASSLHISTPMKEFIRLFPVALPFGRRSPFLSTYSRNVVFLLQFLSLSSSRLETRSVALCCRNCWIPRA